MTIEGESWTTKLRGRRWASPADGYAAIAPARFDRIRPAIEIGYTTEDIAQGRELQAASPSDMAPLDTVGQAKFEQEAIAALKACAIPGNVRELENMECLDQIEKRALLNALEHAQAIAQPRRKHWESRSARCATGCSDCRVLRCELCGGDRTPGQYEIMLVVKDLEGLRSSDSRWSSGLRC